MVYREGEDHRHPLPLRLGAAVKSVNTIGTSARMFLTFLREYYGKDDTQ